MKTDSQLQQDVMAELKWEPTVHAEQIGVEVKDGIVTLAGHVDSFPAKWNAERAAQRVAGVKALAVEIDVKLNGSSKRSDADIARTAENVLLWTTYLPQDSVKVMVESGWVTLTGQVQWAFQRTTATAAVRYLAGVTGVSDQITLKPNVKVSVTSVKDDIESALKRRAVSEANDIKVTVHGTEVTLTGHAPTWADRDAAGSAAWSSHGVTNVVDNIAISY
jgi:osmotically-inducible protein OsmY